MVSSFAEELEDGEVGPDSDGAVCQGLACTQEDKKKESGHSHGDRRFGNKPKDRITGVGRGGSLLLVSIIGSLLDCI